MITHAHGDQNEQNRKKWTRPAPPPRNTPRTDASSVDSRRVAYGDTHSVSPHACACFSNQDIELWMSKGALEASPHFPFPTRGLLAHKTQFKSHMGDLAKPLSFCGLFPGVKAADVPTAIMGARRPDESTVVRCLETLPEVLPIGGHRAVFREAEASRFYHPRGVVNPDFDSTVEELVHFLSRLGSFQLVVPCGYVVLETLGHLTRLVVGVDTADSTTNGSHGGSSTSATANHPGDTPYPEVVSGKWTRGVPFCTSSAEEGLGFMTSLFQTPPPSSIECGPGGSGPGSISSGSAGVQHKRPRKRRSKRKPQNDCPPQGGDAPVSFSRRPSLDSVEDPDREQKKGLDVDGLRSSSTESDPTLSAHGSASGGGVVHNAARLAGAMKLLLQELVNPSGSFAGLRCVMKEDEDAEAVRPCDLVDGGLARCFEVGIYGALTVWIPDSSTAVTYGTGDDGPRKTTGPWQTGGPWWLPPTHPPSSVSQSRHHKASVRKKRRARVVKCGSGSTLSQATTAPSPGLSQFTFSEWTPGTNFIPWFLLGEVIRLFICLGRCEDVAIFVPDVGEDDEDDEGEEGGVREEGPSWLGAVYNVPGDTPEGLVGTAAKGKKAPVMVGKESHVSRPGGGDATSSGGGGSRHQQLRAVASQDGKRRCGDLDGCRPLVRELERKLTDARRSLVSGAAETWIDEPAQPFEPSGFSMRSQRPVGPRLLHWAWKLCFVRVRGAPKVPPATNGFVRPSPGRLSHVMLDPPQWPLPTCDVTEFTKLVRFLPVNLRWKDPAGPVFWSDGDRLCEWSVAVTCPTLFSAFLHGFSAFLYTLEAMGFRAVVGDQPPELGMESRLDLNIVVTKRHQKTHRNTSHASRTYSYRTIPQLVETVADEAKTFAMISLNLEVAVDREEGPVDAVLDCYVHLRTTFLFAFLAPVAPYLLLPARISVASAIVDLPENKMELQELAWVIPSRRDDWRWSDTDTESPAVDPPNTWVYNEFLNRGVAVCYDEPALRFRAEHLKLLTSIISYEAFCR